MYKVFNISWAGLKMHVATFSTKLEAKNFVDNHKDYTLVIE
jgi:hypothetical protein